MSNDMREPIQRRSPLHAAGLAVGKHLDDGELIILLLCPVCLVLSSIPIVLDPKSWLQPSLSRLSRSHLLLVSEAKLPQAPTFLPSQLHRPNILLSPLSHYETHFSRSGSLLVPLAHIQHLPLKPVMKVCLYGHQ